MDCNHFDVYTGPEFEEAVAHELAFLLGHLGGGKGASGGGASSSAGDGGGRDEL